MHIQTLALTNFRGARSLSLDLHPRLNVLVGVNGAGKSTVLDAVTIMLSWAVSRIRQANTSGRHISEEDINNRKAAARIEIMCVDGNQKVTWKLVKTRQGYLASDDATSLTQLSDYTRAIQSRITEEDQNTNIPLFVHYPVTRAVLDIPLRTSKPNYNLLTAYDDALTTGANFRAFFTWFREREDLENEMKVRSTQGYQETLFEIEGKKDEPSSDLEPVYPDPQLEAVRTALTELFPEFENLRVLRSPLRMEVTKNGQPLLINQLSDGEKCLIAMVSDLARRMAIANPARENPLEGDGIILIDEIDLHLHPSWQRIIVPQLMKVFPNCQFLISTHSPHVLTHVHPENIFLLRLSKDDVTAYKPSESYGKSANRILEDLMGLDTTRPDEVSSGLHAIYQMIDSNSLDEAKQEVSRMKQTIGNDPDLIKAEVLIRRKELIGK